MQTRKPLSNGNPTWQFSRTARSQTIDTLRDEAAVARKAAILSRQRFDSRLPAPPHLQEVLVPLHAPTSWACRIHDSTGHSVRGVSGVALPPPEVPVANNRPGLVEANVTELEGAPRHPTLIKALSIDSVVNAQDWTLWCALIVRILATRRSSWDAWSANSSPRRTTGSARRGLAAALRVAARDRWIGWRDEGWRANLGGCRHRNRSFDPGIQIMPHGQTRQASVALGMRSGFGPSRSARQGVSSMLPDQDCLLIRV